MNRFRPFLLLRSLEYLSGATDLFASVVISITSTTLKIDVRHLHLLLGGVFGVVVNKLSFKSEPEKYSSFAENFDIYSENKVN